MAYFMQNVVNAIIDNMIQKNLKEFVKTYKSKNTILKKPNKNTHIRNIRKYIYSKKYSIPTSGSDYGLKKNILQNIWYNEMFETKQIYNLFTLYCKNGNHSPYLDILERFKLNYSYTITKFLILP